MSSETYLCTEDTCCIYSPACQRSWFARIVCLFVCLSEATFLPVTAAHWLEMPPDHLLGFHIRSVLFQSSSLVAYLQAGAMFFWPLETSRCVLRNTDLTLQASPFRTDPILLCVLLSPWALAAPLETPVSMCIINSHLLMWLIHVFSVTP